MTTQRAATASRRPRSAAELRQSFLLNLLYFWVGRFAGFAPYFPGFACAALLFLLVGPRDRAGWLAALALRGLVGSAIILLIPDNWYGGAGTIGNRYFLNVLPLGLLLLPARCAGWAALLALPVTALLLGPVLASPVRHSLHPGLARAVAGLPRAARGADDDRGPLRLHRCLAPTPARTTCPAATRRVGAPRTRRRTISGSPTTARSARNPRSARRASGCAEARAPRSWCRRSRPCPASGWCVTSGPGGDIVTARLGRDRQRLVLPAAQDAADRLHPARAGRRLLRDAALSIPPRIALRVAARPRPAEPGILRARRARSLTAQTTTALGELPWLTSTTIRPAVPCAAARRDRG